MRKFLPQKRIKSSDIDQSIYEFEQNLRNSFKHTGAFYDFMQSHTQQNYDMDLFSFVSSLTSENAYDFFENAAEDFIKISFEELMNKAPVLKNDDIYRVRIETEYVPKCWEIVGNIFDDDNLDILDSFATNILEDSPYSNVSTAGDEEEKKNKVLSELFPDVNTEDVKAAKLMTFAALDFSEEVSKTNLFNRYSLNDKLISIAFAKVAYYHLITRLPIENNLFYAFLQYYFWEHFNLSLLEVYEAIFRIQKCEYLYLMKYYDYDDHANILCTKDFSIVMKAFYHDLKKSSGDKFNFLKNISEEEFAQTIGPIIENRLALFR